MTSSNVTHAMLKDNPSLLLLRWVGCSERSDSGEAGDHYLRARLAAVVADGQSVVTTAERWIPEPPIGGDRQVRLMDDLRYGPDEYTMWPQPFHSDLPHLPCIRTAHQGEAEEILFGDVSSDMWFRPLHTDGFSGLGAIDDRVIDRVITVASQCSARERELEANGRNIFRTPKQREVYRAIHIDIQSFLFRMSCLPSTFLTAQKTVRHLQRLLLEWDAWLRYWELFLPRIQQTLPSTSLESDPTALGCFVYRTQDAEAMQRARLPFWLIRPYEYVLNVYVEDIGYIKTVIDDGKLSTFGHPRDKRVVFTGSASDIRRYENIRAAGRALLSFADPFSAVAAPTPLKPKGSTSRSVGQIRALNRQEQRRLTGSPYSQLFGRSKNHGNRSKFDHPSHPWFPQALPMWRKALAAVNTDEGNFLFEKLDSDACYAFPEPAKLVSTTAPGKDQAMIHSWVKYRSLLLHSMTGLSFQAKPQPARAWEALLTAEYVSTHNQDLDRKRQKLRNDMISFVGHTELEELEEVSLSTADAKWEGRVVGELTATDYERILWELAELNFRFEFQALDTRLMMSRGPQIGRDTSIRRCFPGGCLLVGNWRSANHGIASEHIREKAHYLFLMASLMKDWLGVNAEGLICRVTTQLKWSEEDIELLEDEIAAFYTQSFFNSFRRAPVVPLRLSEQSAPLAGSYTATLAPVMENPRYMIINQIAKGEPTLMESMTNLEYLRHVVE